MNKDELYERVAEHIKNNPPTPVDTGMLNRLCGGKGLSCPIWLQRLLHQTDITYVTAIELGEGGRGVRTADGWVSIEELRELAADDSEG